MSRVVANGLRLIVMSVFALQQEGVEEQSPSVEVLIETI